MTTIALPASVSDGERRAVYATLEENRASMESAVRSALWGRERVHVLEAGGGDATHFGFLANAEFTAVDLSAEQLARNRYAAHRIEADLETFDAYPRRYDLVAVHDVLEHLPHPDKALDILIRQVAPGGLLAIGGPDPASAKGLLTKFTPHAFHVWFYKRVAGYADAGKPGHVPFPAHLRWSVRPHALVARAEAAGLETIYFGVSRPSWMLERVAKRAKPLLWAYEAVVGIARVASLGLWRPDLSDCLLVFRRRS